MRAHSLDNRHIHSYEQYFELSQGPKEIGPNTAKYVTFVRKLFYVHRGFRIKGSELR